MALNPAPTKLDQTQLLQRAFDEQNDRLRTDASATIAGPVEVLINQADDSIKIGDGVNLITSTNSGGGKRGLDVNIASGNTTVSGTVETNLLGLDSFQTSQYTVGASAVQITPTPLAGRSSLSIKVVTTGSDPVYIGNSSGVTTSTGFPLFNGDAVQLDITTTQVIYAIAASAGQKVYALELG